MTTPPTPGGASPADPPQDQPGQPVPDGSPRASPRGSPEARPEGVPAGTPEGIAVMLVLVRILAAYGRHLATVLPQRGLWPGFATVARFLGNQGLADSLARIHRGILRAIALERLLLKRAGRGRDLKVRKREPQFYILTAPGMDPETVEENLRQWERRLDARHAKAAARRAAAQAPDPAADPQAVEARFAAGPQYATNRVSDRRPLCLEHLPSLAEIEREVARRPIGRTLSAICTDLGVWPGLCQGGFWNALFEAMNAYGGSVNQVVVELQRRAIRFDKEDWKHPRLPLPEHTVDGVRRVMGFVI